MFDGNTILTLDVFAEHRRRAYEGDIIHRRECCEGASGNRMLHYRIWGYFAIRSAQIRNVVRCFPHRSRFHLPKTDVFENGAANSVCSFVYFCEGVGVRPAFGILSYLLGCTEASDFCAPNAQAITVFNWAYHSLPFSPSHSPDACTLRRAQHTRGLYKTSQSFAFLLHVLASDLGR